MYKRVRIILTTSVYSKEIGTARMRTTSDSWNTVKLVFHLYFFLSLFRFFFSFFNSVSLSRRSIYSRFPSDNTHTRAGRDDVHSVRRVRYTISYTDTVYMLYTIARTVNTVNAQFYIRIWQYTHTGVFTSAVGMFSIFFQVKRFAKLKNSKGNTLDFIFKRIITWYNTVRVYY